MCVFVCVCVCVHINYSVLFIYCTDTLEETKEEKKKHCEVKASGALLQLYYFAFGCYFLKQVFFVNSSPRREEEEKKRCLNNTKNSKGKRDRYKRDYDI